MESQPIHVYRITVAILLGFILVAPTAWAEYVNPYSPWSNGPSTDPDYFPIGVWLQDPSTAAQWKAAHVNLFVGQWQGPTTEQLDTLQAADMQVIAEMNENAVDAASRTLSDGRPLVVGWMQPDEPDNAQWTGTQWGPPIPTSTIQDNYADIKAFDTTRPVYMGLSQGLGWDSQTWFGQGGYIVPQRDYPAYLAGTDIMSMDIYPMDCGRSETCGDAWRPARGTDGLYQYGGTDKPAWNALETGDISANDLEATVEEIRMEVWSAIIHGSKGVIWFIHGKTNISDFDHKALLRPENAAHLAGVTAINAEILSLAPVINSQSLNHLVTVQSSNPAMPIDMMVKQHDGSTYLFATGMRDGTTAALFSFAGFGDRLVDVIGEDRQLSMIDGQFVDPFAGFEAHLYQIGAASVVGDYNNNGAVEQGDLDLVLLHWGEAWPPEIPGWINQQPIDDGVIDQNDLDGVLLNWGNSTAAATTVVPEPTSIVLLLFGSLALFRYRKRSSNLQSIGSLS